MNNHWQPATESYLRSMLSLAEADMSAEFARFWHQIRLPLPELWQQHPWADEVCGFWVVAVMGKSCVYYNDRTQGFALGSFSHWGRIDDYLPSRLSLYEQIRSLLQPVPLLSEA